MSKPDYVLTRIGLERISARQIDELIGLARGIAADGDINQGEAEFLQRWLAANAEISRQPVIGTLYDRITEMLSDGHFDDDERRELLDTLNAFSSRDFELGEVLKATTLPLCNPVPTLSHPERRYCFTGTFNYGDRRTCETAAIERGAEVGSLSQKTHVLVIGMYATDSWKHSSFGTKILKAVSFREAGHPISIVSEEHWSKSL